MKSIDESVGIEVALERIITMTEMVQLINELRAMCVVVFKIMNYQTV